MYKKFIIKTIAIITAAVFIFSTGFWLGINFFSARQFASRANVSSLFELTTQMGSAQEDQQPVSMETLEEVIDLIIENSIYEMGREEILRHAIDGILDGLGDRHAEYFSYEEYNQIMESYSGTMSGIGVVVTLDDMERVVIVNVIPETPAYQAGLEENDIINAVEGESILGLSLEKVVSMIRGEEGTSVNLTIYRPSDRERFEVDISRESFYVPNVFSEMASENIGYIQYLGFQEMGAEKLEFEIGRLLDKGAEGLILDLRNNLGGVLTDAVAVADLFLEEGTIVSIEGRAAEEGDANIFQAKKGGYTDIPLVVLINGFSASASELAAGALQENERAILVGESSFGKGTVQTIRELSDGSGFKFTTAKYLLPSGRSIEEVGVRPDIEVQMDFDAQEDLQLEAALEALAEMIDNHG